MRTSDFDYALPDELIAQSPMEPRDACRLLVLDRRTGAVEHRIFRDIVDYLQPGDLLVANETRVRPARLIGRKAVTGGEAEVFLLKPILAVDPTGRTWECLVRPGRRLKTGALVEFTAGGDAGDDVELTAEIVDFGEGKGSRLVRFTPVSGSLDDAIHRVGAVPLPPYITDDDGDPELYQTVFSARESSAAAPTAGLHFTPDLLAQLERRDIGFATVDLSVGVDTFRIVEEEDPRDHVIHTETYTVSPAVVDAVTSAKQRGGRVIAVGTTSVRSLESAFDPELGRITSREDEKTSLFLVPGAEFHVVDAMITNFHVPRSTLMMLVSAFAGRENIMAAYEEAVRERYRMLSFGDAMFIR